MSRPTEPFASAVLGEMIADLARDGLIEHLDAGPRGLHVRAVMPS
jgi:hypothetical protein